MYTPSNGGGEHINLWPRDVHKIAERQHLLRVKLETQNNNQHETKKGEVMATAHRS